MLTTGQTDELIQQKEKDKESTQGELDDMLMLFADAEEKVNKYKEKLQALGETISDDEDGDDDEDDEDDEEEEQEEEEEAEEGSEEKKKGDGQDGEVD